MFATFTVWVWRLHYTCARGHSAITVLAGIVRFVFSALQRGCGVERIVQRPHLLSKVFVDSHRKNPGLHYTNLLIVAPEVG